MSSLLEHGSRFIIGGRIRDFASRVIIERREFGLNPSSRMRIDAAADGAALDAPEAIQMDAKDGMSQSFSGLCIIFKA